VGPGDADDDFATQAFVKALTPVPEVGYARWRRNKVWGASMAKKTKKSDPKSAKDRTDKGLVKHVQFMVPDPKPVRVTKVTIVPPKLSTARARQRHAQLSAARFGADPRLA